MVPPSWNNAGTVTQYMQRHGEQRAHPASCAILNAFSYP